MLAQQPQVLGERGNLLRAYWLLGILYAANAVLTVSLWLARCVNRSPVQNYPK
jgi:hypothetical protein